MASGVVRTPVGKKGRGAVFTSSWFISIAVPLVVVSIFAIIRWFHRGGPTPIWDDFILGSELSLASLTVSLTKTYEWIRDAEAPIDNYYQMMLGLGASQKIAGMAGETTTLTSLDWFALKVWIALILVSLLSLLVVTVAMQDYFKHRDERQHANEPGISRRRFTAINVIGGLPLVIALFNLLESNG